MKHAYFSKIFIGCFLAIVLTLSSGLSVFASVKTLTSDTGCDELPSYTGNLELKAGDYDVYVRLARIGDTAIVKSYVQLPGQHGNCTLLGDSDVQASGNRWIKAGSFSAFRAQEYIFQLSSDSLSSLPNANRPSIMLVPKNSSICIPSEKCDVSIGSEKGYVLPPGTLLNKNSLHVLLLINPSTDAVKRVYYYVDSELVYKSNLLQPFDERYIAYPEQSLTRVIKYASGQDVVIESKSSTTHQDSLSNFIFRLSQKYPKTLLFIAWIAGIFCVALILLASLRLLQRRYDYRVHHGFIPERKLTSLEKWYYFMRDKKATHYVRYLMLILLSIAAIAVLIITTTTYLAQLITVDGHSMEKTYYTGDVVFVNKVPKTISSLNGREYVPRRGQVVIVRGSFGKAILSNDDATTVTLIKRVIGLPGERVIVKDGVMTVYNQEHPSGFVPDQGSAWEKDMTLDEPSENIDIQLGQSEIFVSGDNRPESIDSRFSGPIATKEVIGEVIFRAWPLN